MQLKKNITEGKELLQGKAPRQATLHRRGNILIKDSLSAHILTMPTCAIAHCHNGSGRKERPHLDGTTATVHRIPPTEGLQKQWEERINRQNFKVNKDTTVCSLHFDFDAFVDEADNRDKYNRKRKKKEKKKIVTFDM